MFGQLSKPNFKQRIILAARKLSFPSPPPSAVQEKTQEEHLASFPHSFAGSLKAIITLGCSQPSQKAFTAHHAATELLPAPESGRALPRPSPPPGSAAGAGSWEMPPRPSASGLRSSSQAVAKQGWEFSIPASENIPQSGPLDLSQLLSER